jgi:hypothetical protein
MSINAINLKLWHVRSSEVKKKNGMLWTSKSGNISVCGKEVKMKYSDL